MADDPKQIRATRSDHGWTEDARRAHEVRTQLTVIVARAQIVRRRLRAGTLRTVDLDRAFEQIERAVARLEREVERWDGTRAAASSERDRGAT